MKQSFNKLSAPSSIHSTLRVVPTVKTTWTKNSKNLKNASVTIKELTGSTSARCRDTMFKPVPYKTKQEEPKCALGKIAKIGRSFNSIFDPSDHLGKAAKAAGFIGRLMPSAAGGYSIAASERAAMEHWIDKHNAEINRVRPDLELEYDTMLARSKARIGMNAREMNYPDVDVLKSWFRIEAIFYTEPEEVGRSGFLTAITNEVKNKTAAQVHHNKTLQDNNMLNAVEYLVKSMLDNAKSLHKSHTEPNGRVTQKRVNEIQEALTGAKDLMARYNISDVVADKLSKVFNTAASSIQHVDMKNAAPPEREEAIDLTVKGAAIIEEAKDDMMSWG